MILEDLEKLFKPSPEPKYIDGYVETNVTEDMINFPKSGACLHHEVIAKALEEDKMKEMKYYFEKYKENEGKTDNDQLLDNYIQQVSDQQNQIVELQKTIMELRNKIEENERTLILKDIERIFDEFLDIPDGTTTLKDDLVDYILERENKG